MLCWTALQFSIESRIFVVRNLFPTCLAVVTLLTPSNPLAAADPGYKIVVNEANITSSMTTQQLSRLFMKEATSWIDGSPVLPVDQVSSSEIRKKFSKAVLKRDVNAIKSHWQRLIFSGKGVPPPEKKSDAEVLDFVRANPGGVGYVASAATLGTGVRELVVSGN